MAQEYHVYDGAAWRKAKHIYAHDGTAWRKVKTAFVRDASAWRCVYHDKEWIRRLSASYGITSLHGYRGTNKLVALANDSSRAWSYDGTTWTDIGAPPLSSGTGISFVGFGASGDIYSFNSRNSGEIFRYSGGTWVSEFVTATAPTAAQFFDDASGDTYWATNITGASGAVWRKTGGSWSRVASSPRMDLAYAHTASVTYAARFDTIYTVSGSAFTALANQPTNPITSIYVDTSNDLWASGTFGLFKYNGSSWTPFTSADRRHICQDDANDLVVGVPVSGYYSPHRGPLAWSETAKVEMQYPAAPSNAYMTQRMVRLNDGRLFAIASHAAAGSSYHLFEWTAK
jgi:hypothetical protein